MASRQQNKEGEKSKTNLVKREAKIDATLTQKLITSPLSQGWHHLDALWDAVFTISLVFAEGCFFLRPFATTVLLVSAQATSNPS